jgi:DNA replicative helicase MCM subunit Mcm2 (Cdc46/Mcm family)
MLEINANQELLQRLLKNYRIFMLRIDKKLDNKKKLNPNSIPITVRQLEAIIRLSESLAKMKLRT